MARRQTAFKKENFGSQVESQNNKTEKIK